MVVNDEARWHLDKRVPIALILTIFIQTVGIVWWAATVTSRVDRLEEKANIAQELNNRVIRMEEQLKASNRILYDIRTEIRKR